MLKNITAIVYYYSLLLLSFTLPFPRIISNVLIIILVINWLTSSSVKEKFFLFKKQKIGFLFISIFLLNCLGLLYSEDVGLGLFKIEKILTILVFPLIILTSPQLSIKQFNNILKVFVAGVLTASIIAITYAFYRRFVIKNLSYLELNSFYIEIPHIFMTHVYFGIYLVLAIYFTVYLYSHKTSRTSSETITTAIIVCFLTTLVFTSGSFMSFIALVVSIVIFLSVYLSRNYKKIYVAAALILMLGVLFALVNSNHPSINRYKQRIFLSWEHVENDRYNYSSTRVGPLKAGLNAAKEHWLWGVGTGDTEAVMEKHYNRQNLDQLVYLNTHNQYLDFLITFGIFGLCLYLVSLLYPMYLSIKKPFFLYTFFLILISLSSVTENILATNKGIVIYALFNSIFAYQVNKSRENDHDKIKVL